MPGLNTTIIQKTVALAPDITASVSVKGKLDAAIGVGIAGLALSYDPQTGVSTISFSALGGIANISVGNGALKASAGAGTIVGAKVGVIGAYAKIEAVVQTKIGLMDLKIENSLLTKTKVSIVAATLEGNVTKNLECFPAGTPITLASGKTIAIEDITIADQVAVVHQAVIHTTPRQGDLQKSNSTNTTNPININVDNTDIDKANHSLLTAPLQAGTVSRLYTNVTKKYVELNYTDPTTGKQTTLTATPGHVFLDENGNWRQIDEMIAANDNSPQHCGQARL